MPAAAVIPAPIAYIKVVAVKKLVVEVVFRCGSVAVVTELNDSFSHLNFWDCYFEEIRVLQASFALNTTAWYNDIRLLSMSLGPDKSKD